MFWINTILQVASRANNRVDLIHIQSLGVIEIEKKGNFPIASTDAGIIHLLIWQLKTTFSTKQLNVSLALVKLKAMEKFILLLLFLLLFSIRKSLLMDVHDFWQPLPELWGPLTLPRCWAIGWCSGLVGSVYYMDVCWCRAWGLEGFWFISVANGLRALEWIGPKAACEYKQEMYRGGRLNTNYRAKREMQSVTWSWRETGRGKREGEGERQWLYESALTQFWIPCSMN